MCELNSTAESLLSGLIGSIIGALFTVWATHKTIKATATEHEKQWQKEKERDHQDRLSALRTEIQFNAGLDRPDTNKKIAVFLHVSWENFLSNSGRLDKDMLNLLNETYASAIFHNSAAKLEKVGTENFGS